MSTTRCVVRPRPATLAVASFVGVAVFVAVAGTGLARQVGFSVVLGSGLAAVGSIPLAVAGVAFAGRYDPDTTLWRGTVGVLAVGVAVAVWVAITRDPGDGPLIGAAAVGVGLFWWVTPLAVGSVVGRARGVSFRRLLVGWPVAALVGFASFFLSGGLLWDGVISLDGPSRAAAAVVTSLVVICGPVAVGGVVARLRA